MRRPRPAPPQADDVPARPILLAGLALFVGLLLSAGLVAAMLGTFQHARPVAEAPPQPVPAPPRLQANPPADRIAAENRALAELQGTARVDRAAGRVRIPIEQAMRLQAQRGWAGPEDPP
ncbi:hypothetical protein [Inquilinus sp.]|uniref:hypothetical protein n=1 Tax=Inquilinus sp. TaxID=1932117 RepID=UPI0031D6193B